MVLPVASPMYILAQMTPSPGRPGLLGRAGLVAGCLALLAACDPRPGGRDAASAPLLQRVSEVSVRIDVPTGGAPAISVLAFRASVSGLEAGQVLGVVDPLMMAGPERCEVRDVAAAARNLGAVGGAIELEALASVSLALDDDPRTIRPTAGVYPQLASAVGGVVAEAGPVDLMAPPRSLTISLPDSETPVKMDVSPVPRLLDAAGSPLTVGPRLEPSGELALTISGPARSFIEIRPYGASQALACPLGAGGRVVVPHELLERVVPSGGHVPVYVEAVWRDSRLVSTPGSTARLSLEMRSSTVLDLPAAPTVP
jgi:hypothetical protein